MVDKPLIRPTPTVRSAGSPPDGGWLGRLLRPLFGRIRVDDEVAARLSETYQRGLVVHVFRASRLTDPLFLLYALERLALAPPRWMHDHYASSTADGSLDALRRSLKDGHPAVLFLRRPRTWWNPSGTYPEAHVEALLNLQRQLDRPVLLLPETLQWTKRPTGLRPTVIDSIFGNREAPGRIRELLGFAWNHADARFHVGVPVDLSEVLKREAGRTDRVAARKVRWAIANHLSREERLRTGPVVRSSARTRHMVLKDPAVRRFFAAQAEKGKRTEPLEKKAESLLKTIAADMRYGWLRVLDIVVDRAWSRIYDGIVVDKEGLAKVRTAAHRGSVVLMPSHKSHIDYIVMSQVFFKEGLLPPLVAAGDNLNFWPLGFIFRRAGAFFIRRSFSDKLYAVVFAAYVRRLLKEGHALEFFIEGGRSRTGKLLPPRTGLLSMCVDPVIDGKVNDVAFVPVSIGYEKIIEARAYANELAGGEKKKEDARGLLASAKLLRSRYGRVYVDFAEPVSLRRFAEERGRMKTEAGADDRTDRKDLVTQLGHRIVNGINEVTRATPTSVAALILLARARRGLAEAELYRRADRAIEFLTDLGARISTPLGPATRQAALRQALGRFAAEGTVRMVTAPDGETIFQLDDVGRQALDYYKNNILHFLVPPAVVALALVCTPDQPADRDTVARAAQRISRLLKNEFSFRVDLTFSENFAEACRMLDGWGILTPTNDHQLQMTAAGRSEARELARLLAPFLEAYRIIVEVLDETRAKPLPERKLVALALTVARRQVIEGKLTRAEAAVQPTLKRGLATMKDEGVVPARGTMEVIDEQARVRLREELSWLLRLLSDEA